MMRGRVNLCADRIWGTALAALLAFAPLLLGSRFQLGLMSQMCAMAVFALSYNLLLGQTGMLSFGHAVYAGLGGFAVVHLLRAMETGAFTLPVAMLPLAGGLASAAFAALIGHPTTRRGGTPFAMISLAIGELVHAAAAMLPEWFGGEGGLTADRTAGPALFRGMEAVFSLGPDTNIYYLTAFWTVASAIAMRALGRTPLLMLANAVRDNPQRVAFVGQNPHLVRYGMLVLAAFFAGIAGALWALNFEIASVDGLGMERSAIVLLAVVVGGSGFFLGPVLGAVVVTLFSVALSRYTGAWQLYLGLAFAATVLFAPHGLAGAVHGLARRIAGKGAAAVVRESGWGAVGTLALALGLCWAVELAYAAVHAQAEAASPASPMHWMLDPSVAGAWAGAACLSLGGAACLAYRRTRSSAAQGARDG